MVGPRVKPEDDDSGWSRICYPAKASIFVIGAFFLSACEQVLDEVGRQFVEMRDDMAPLEFRDRHVGITEGHADGGNAGIAGDKDVVEAVADHHRAFWIGLGKADGAEQV